MGAHLIDQPFWALNLGAPKTIQASSTPFNKDSYPLAEIITYEFGARGECSVKVPFAGRSLEVVFHNPRRLKPGQYKVMGVRAGGRAVPCEPREQGGVLIRRRELSRLPAGRTIRLDVPL